MPEDNAFSRILNRMSDSDSAVTEKTASVSPEVTSEARMLQQVRTVSEAATKTASAPAPATALQEMAKSAQASEQELLTKQAHFMGAAVADGFMERYAAYDTALSAQGVKTASTSNPLVVKQAAQAGYQQAVTDMEKQASAQYAQGYKDQLKAIHKTAAEIHYTGQMVAHNLVEQSRANNK